MTSKKCYIVAGSAILSLCLGSFCMTPNVSAQGRMIVKPSIEAGWRQDSNFYKAETDAKTVDTYYIKPGIELGYVTDKSQILLDYWLKDYNYNDQDDVDPGEMEAEDFDYTGHRADLSARLQATDRILLGLENLYWKTRDPANADIFSNAVDRFKYDTNRLSPWLKYSFGEKFNLEIRYTSNILDYKDDGPGEGEDSEEDRGTVTLEYNLNRRTSLDLDYQYWTRDYDRNTVDYDSQQIMANINQQINYFTFTAGAGYQERDFEEDIPGGDIETFAWRASLYGQNPPERVDIPRSSIFISVSSNLNDVGTGQTYFESTRYDATLSHLFYDKINLILSAWFQDSDYETSDREDERWYVSGTADYLINDYLTAGIEAGREERNSNLAGRDFENEFFAFNLKFNYDLASSQL